MRLRKLEEKDAPIMLEWMHDDSVVKDLQTDFASKSIEDCLKFIQNSWTDGNNIHMAITENEDNDEYLGTVSLKNIHDNTAEFAITIRSVAMGKGVAKLAMNEIIDKGFKEYNLESIYWCVSPNNTRALRFYDKNGYQRVDSDALDIQGYSNTQISNYIWYLVSREERRNGISSK